MLAVSSIILISPCKIQCANEFIFLGWKDCSNLILNLIQDSRLIHQFASFVHLAFGLLGHYCIDGAQQVVDRLLSILDQLDLTDPQYCLNDARAIYGLFKIVVSLEADEMTADSQRIPQVLSFFRRLPIRLQCRLIAGWDSIMMSPNNGLFFDLYKQLCRQLASAQLPSNSRRIRAQIIQLVKCYLKIEDNRLLTSFMDNIFHSEPTSPRNCQEKILRSKWIWEQSLIVDRITNSAIAKKTFFTLFDDWVSFVQQNSSPELTTSARKKLCRCLSFAIRMETYPLLADPWRLTSFSALVSKLLESELAQLLLGLTSFECELADKQDSSVVSCICRQLLSNGTSSLIKLKNGEFVSVVRRFICLKKESQLVACICHSYEDTVEKNRMIELMLSLPEIQHPVNPPDVILPTRLALTKSWIRGYIWILDPLYPASGEAVEFPDDTPSKIAKCFKEFVYLEKNWPENPKVKSVGRLFLKVFVLLSFKFLLELIVDIYNFVASSELLPLDSSPDQVTCPLFLILFRDLCRRCLAHRDYNNFTPPSCSLSQHEILFKSFLLLRDDVSLTVICRKLCCVEADSSAVIKKIVNCSEIQQLASSSSAAAKTAFLILLDHRIKALQVLTYPVISWSHPEASFPENPDIEEFLRSPLERLTIGNLANSIDAREFADLLRDNGSFGLDVKIKRTLGGSCDVEIVKAVGKVVSASNEAEAAELEQLETLRKKT